MWSGAPQWSSWQMQPGQFQNVQSDQVDWAALAKQWIQMKEVQDDSTPNQIGSQTFSGRYSSLSEGQVANGSGIQPSVSAVSDDALKQDTFSVVDTVIAGEMDMEIEDDKETAISINGEAWSGSWSGGNAPENVIPPGGAPGWGWSWQPPVGNNAAPAPPPNVRIPYDNNNQTSGTFWHPPPSTSSGPIEYGRRDKRRKESVVVENRSSDVQLDAAQRKKLPAWIREGLEKMEREKQRKLEKEKEINEKEEAMKKRREEEVRARQILENDLVGPSGSSEKSKFVITQDSDSDGSEHSKSPVLYTMPPQDVKEQEETPNQNAKKCASPAFFKTDEEIMQEMLQKIRKWMTEILLDVTTEMIMDVSSEVINRARMKGLGAYSDSEPEQEALENSCDSDEELRLTIRRKKKEFQFIEKNILTRINKEEMDEEESNENREIKSEQDSVIGETSPHESITETTKSQIDASSTGMVFYYKVFWYNLIFSESPKAESSPEGESEQVVSDSKSSDSDSSLKEEVRKKKRLSKKDRRYRRDRSYERSKERKRKRKRGNSESHSCSSDSNRHAYDSSFEESSPKVLRKGHRRYRSRERRYDSDERKGKRCVRSRSGSRDSRHRHHRYRSRSRSRSRKSRDHRRRRFRRSRS